jgi:methylmalonyl-CoA mutase
MRIEESAARKQARIDQGLDVIVGVNKYKLDEDTQMDVLEVSDEVRNDQIRMKTGSKPIATMRPRAAPWRRHPGRRKRRQPAGSLHRRPSGPGPPWARFPMPWKRCSAASWPPPSASPGFTLLNIRTASHRLPFASAPRTFMEKEGRRPRILLTKMGQDGHDRGIKVVATAFADLGFDVDISPMFQTPEEAAKMAVENDVHLVGASSLAAGHKALVPQLIEALKAAGGDDIQVIVGGVIPPGDYDFLYQAGAVGVFGPGTAITDSANKVLNALDSRKSA